MIFNLSLLESSTLYTFLIHLKVVLWYSTVFIGIHIHAVLFWPYYYFVPGIVVTSDGDDIRWWVWCEGGIGKSRWATGLLVIRCWSFLSLHCRCGACCCCSCYLHHSENDLNICWWTPVCVPIYNLLLFPSVNIRCWFCIITGCWYYIGDCGVLLVMMRLFCSCCCSVNLLLIRWYLILEVCPDLTTGDTWLFITIAIDGYHIQYIGLTLTIVVPIRYATLLSVDRYSVNIQVLLPAFYTIYSGTLPTVFIIAMNCYSLQFVEYDSVLVDIIGGFCWRPDGLHRLHSTIAVISIHICWRYVVVMTDLPLQYSSGRPEENLLVIATLIRTDIIWPVLYSLRPVLTNSTGGICDRTLPGTFLQLCVVFVHYLLVVTWLLGDCCCCSSFTDHYDCDIQVGLIWLLEELYSEKSQWELMKRKEMTWAETMKFVIMICGDLRPCVWACWYDVLSICTKAKMTWVQWWEENEAWR